MFEWRRPRKVNVLLVAEEAAGVQTLRAILNGGHRLIGVVTSETSDLRRGATVRGVAESNGCRLWPADSVKHSGFADEIRAQGLPADHPTDIAYFTRFARHELARFSLPSSRDARQLVTTLSGSWSAAELPHRCNQKFIEPVLRRHAEALPGVSVHYGCRMNDFRDLGDHVEVNLDGNHSIKASYLVGADGPRSAVRQALGIRYAGETGITRFENAYVMIELSSVKVSSLTIIS